MRKTAARPFDQPEPWLRESLPDVPAVPRAVLHALQLAAEDLHTWCDELTNQELRAHPHGLPSVAFQLRHIAHSMDRLLTYAEARVLSPEQLADLKTEAETTATTGEELFAELDSALDKARNRVRALAHQDFEQLRTVGKKMLPTTLGGLLVHVADHTQRHVGQAVTTAKIILAERNVT
ncbi:MAG TPA: DinB family protein [Candidatus Saccharimonadales bacterium]|nr:DinB family protein [Candidatus Saccharimonadales bacterium]